MFGESKWPHLVWVAGALGHHLLPLPGHQVEQLVDEEGGREAGDAPRGDGDELAAHRAPELAVPGEGGHDPGEALQADGVRAGQQLRDVLLAVEHAWGGAGVRGCLGAGLEAGRIGVEKCAGGAGGRRRNYSSRHGNGLLIRAKTHFS